MGVKKGGKSKGVRSNGERPNVAKKISNAVRLDYVGTADQLINQLRAHRKGRRVSVTIGNPNKAETNKRFIKVPGSVAFKNAEKPKK